MKDTKTDNPQNKPTSGKLSDASACSVCDDDLRSLHELVPLEPGEYLRHWMLRCVCRGLITVNEALTVKANNTSEWHCEYELPNVKHTGREQ